jgi:hypothetical protein
MKTIKVSEATNIQLDWLVWKCAGGAAAYPKTASGKAFLKLWTGNSAKYAHPSTDWAQGGPIIERGGMGVWQYQWDSAGEPNPGWYAEDKDGNHVQTGTTPLIAAARCYVTSELGDTVEVPEELG